MACAMTPMPTGDINHRAPVEHNASTAMSRQRGRPQTSLLLTLSLVAASIRPLDGFLSTAGRPYALCRSRFDHSSSCLVPLQSTASPDNEDTLNEEESTTSQTASSSKREMLKFAGPALGIYLANPLLSNIDNAFVGHAVGTTGLAALAPATVLTDQMLYLFSFLARATTGLVSQAYKADPITKQGDTAAAREAGSAPLTVSLLCGVFLSLLYAMRTPQLLQLFRVHSSLRPSAAAYIYWRGTAAWAALAQTIALSMLLSTRDAITPLKIIAAASVLNVLGDALFCIQPFQWGCAGAAAATSIATLVSSSIMVRALKRKQLLPTIRLPRRDELKALFEFTGPLFLITITRLAGFIVMNKSVMALGSVQALAAYQLCFNLLIFFLLFGEPLSQLSQTQLPALIQAQDGTAARATLKSALILASFTALAIGGVAFGMVAFGSSLFSSDVAVQRLARQTAPSIFAAVSTAVFTVAVDGSMLASKDFGFMLSCGLATFVLQVSLLRNYCTSVGFVFGTFTMRLGVYAILALGRMALGRGTLGRLFRKRGRQPPSTQQA